MKVLPVHKGIRPQWVVLPDGLLSEVYMKEQPMHNVLINWHKQIIHVINAAVHVPTPTFHRLEAGRLQIATVSVRRIGRGAPESKTFLVAFVK